MIVFRTVKRTFEELASLIGEEVEYWILREGAVGVSRQQCDVRNHEVGARMTLSTGIL